MAHVLHIAPLSVTNGTFHSRRLRRFAPLLHIRGLMKVTPMVFEVKGTTALTASITLRLAPEEKDRLKSDADMAGLSVSEIVRRHYFGRPVIANADLVMVKEMRRMGGLMKHLHNESDGTYRMETAEAINAIVRYIDTLTAAERKR